MTANLKIKNDRYYAVINYKDGSEYKQKWVSLGLPTKNNKRKAEAMLDEVRRKSKLLRDGESITFARNTD